MIIKEKIGTLSQYPAGERTIDWLWLEWYETGKRILHKKTEAGREVALKYLKEAPGLTEGDVLYDDGSVLIVVGIKPCETIVIKPASLYRMASLCYEIWNKHLPLFYEEYQVLVPYEAPLFRLLQAAGYEPLKEIRKLVDPLRTTVRPHSGHVPETTSLFSRILQLTSSGND